MCLAASEAQPQLPQRYKISIKKKPWRLADSDPNAQAHNPLLDCCHNFPERENLPRRDNKSDHAENGKKLNPTDTVCFFQERQTICASHLAHKSGQLAGRVEMQEWRDQINA